MSLLVCGWDEGLLRRLLARQAEVVLVVDDSENSIATVAELAPQLHRLHVLSSLEQLAELAAVAVSEQLAGQRFDEIVGATEPAQLAAGYLAALLDGQPTAALSSVLLRDKRAMKERLRPAGIPVARQSTVPADLGPEAALALIEQGVGWPAVLKPVAGTGARDTVVLTDRSQAPGLLDSALGAGTLMAEQYLSGLELHIDAVWSAGEPRVFGVSRYVIPRVEVRTSGRDNGSALLPEPDYRELYRDALALHRQVNEALGIHTAITHLEVFLDETGKLWFSEVAGRAGGGGINRTFEAAEVDLREAFADVLTGRDDQAGRVRYPQRLVGWVNLAPDRTGRIGRIPDQDALAEPYLLRVQQCVSDGEDLSQLSPLSWVCLAVFGADSWTQYLERARTLETKAVELMSVG